MEAKKSRFFILLGPNEELPFVCHRVFRNNLLVDFLAKSESFRQIVVLNNSLSSLCAGRSISLDKVNERKFYLIGRTYNL